MSDARQARLAKIEAALERLESKLDVLIAALADDEAEPPTNTGTLDDDVDLPSDCSLEYL